MPANNKIDTTCEHFKNDKRCTLKAIPDWNYCFLHLAMRVDYKSVRWEYKSNTDSIAFSHHDKIFVYDRTTKKIVKMLDKETMRHIPHTNIDEAKFKALPREML